MMRARSAASILSAVIALAVGAARAEPTPEGSARLFEEGLAAYDAGQHARAVELWERLLAEGEPDKAWRVLYNLGLAYEAAGDRPRAIERFEAFSRRVGEQPGSLPIEFEGRRQDAVERAGRLRPNLSLLRIAPAKTGELVKVSIDGGPERDAGFATYLEPGSHTLRMGEGPRAIQVELKLTAGEMFTKLAEQLPPPPPPPYQAPIHPGVLIGGASLTAASVAVPVALYFRARSLRDDAAALPLFDPRYAAARDSYDQASTTYLATWSIPATLGAATLVMLVIDLVDASATDDEKAAPPAVALRPRAAGLEVSFP